MAQAPTNPKIEELRFKLKLDAKSRLFFQLAEELRRIDQLAEAEQVLRNGLAVHTAYLSAWVSLGRVLREQGKQRDAVDALTKALQVDPGNVVAARLLADCYYELGEKVEAIKKYKLVHALMPSDVELEELIARIDNEINAPPPESAFAPVVAEEEPPAAPESEPQPEPEPEPEPMAASAEAENPFAQKLWPTMETPFGEEPSAADAPFAADEAAEAFAEEQSVAVATGDVEPMLAAHAESPFEEPVSEATADAVEVEQPAGIHIEEAPLAAEVPAPWSEEEEAPVAAASPWDEEPAAEVFAPSSEDAAIESPDDKLTNTATMGDLYARQGLTDQARDIYEHVLQRDPANDAVRDKLDALAPQSAPESDMDESGRNPKVAKLEKWLDKVAKREVSRV
jgi:tetratricopeptide (TPR) repeat protein